MFPNTSALRVVQYTPKVSTSINHKLPAKPSWNNSGKEPAKPLAASKKAADDSEREKRRTTAMRLMIRDNPLSDIKTVEGVLT
jgi:hypothetical protein